MNRFYVSVDPCPLRQCQLDCHESPCDSKLRYSFQDFGNSIRYKCWPAVGFSCQPVQNYCCIRPCVLMFILQTHLPENFRERLFGFEPNIEAQRTKRGFDRAFNGATLALEVGKLPSAHLARLGLPRTCNGHSQSLTRHKTCVSLLNQQISLFFFENEPGKFYVSKFTQFLFQF